MLTSFSAENFLSIHEKIELNLSVGLENLDPQKYVALAGEAKNPTPIATAAALYGANASGKSNILKALSFLGWLAFSSQQNPNPFLPFRNWFQNEKPTVLSCKFLDLTGTAISYDISFKQQEIISEELKQGQEILFKRAGQDIFPEALKSKVPLESLRKNVSFLSFAMSFNQFKAIGDLFSFRSGLENSQWLPKFLFSQMFQQRDPEEITKDFELISELDLGISTLKFRETPKGGTEEFSELRGRQLEIFAEHTLPDGKVSALPFSHESFGTQSALLLAGYLRSTLEKGGLLIIDELEENLHPHVVAHLLSLFQSSETNPKKAQLIFSTHLPELMDQLNAYNIFLTEKRLQATDLWRLDDIANLERSESYKERYLQGAFDGVPRIGFSG